VTSHTVRQFCGGRWGRAISVAACLALGACGLSQGIAEFEIYRAAFEKTYGTSTAILDQLAVQERELFLRSRQGRIDPTNVKFDPNLARYYTDTTDPPGTAAYRRALETVKAYNDLLYGLASGQTAEALVSKLGELNSKVGEAAGEVGALLGGPAQGDLLAATTALNQVFGQIAPFVRLGLTFRSREEFRVYIVQNYPTVRDLLAELRRGTRAIFPVLTAATVRRMRNAPTGGLTADETKKLETYRKLLADWVILIDATLKSLDNVVAAVEEDPTIVSTITGLTSVAVELETASQAARKHLAELSK
jgi:hypothetical protein